MRGFAFPSPSNSARVTGCTAYAAMVVSRSASASMSHSCSRKMSSTTSAWSRPEVSFAIASTTPRSSSMSGDRGVSRYPKVCPISSVHSAYVSVFSLTIASGVNVSPKMVPANSSTFERSSSPPSVADVATGVTRPSGFDAYSPANPSGWCCLSISPNRRSSSATSVPCAPS